eukprot:COSAG02_NODE_4250_length_5586_cov_2.460725_3_plen_58_part_00
MAKLNCGSSVTKQSSREVVTEESEARRERMELLRHHKNARIPVMAQEHFASSAPRLR